MVQDIPRTSEAISNFDFVSIIIILIFIYIIDSGNSTFIASSYYRFVYLLIFYRFQKD